MNGFLPTSIKEIKALGWESIDVILFTGDAYIDHPSFGVAIIARLLEKLGLKVAVVPQPNWRDDLRDFKKLGRPNLFFGVTSGNMDSMINHYTANKRLRSDDAYTPDGKAGQRPNYASYVYTKIVKQLYPDVPIILGGIEASLRRFVHYDYWSDSLKPSILLESGADFLLYGMAEKTIVEIASIIRNGSNLEAIRKIRQVAYVLQSEENIIDSKEYPTIELNSYEACRSSKKAFADNFRIIEEESNKMHAARLVEKSGNKYVVVNPPFETLNQDDIDAPFNLPYTRLPHPRYEGKGSIPAFDMIKNSINIHRGCFGGCSFCTISAHQGKFIQSRSEKSVLEEVNQLTKMPYFNGTITDLGGPSANMYKMQGKNLFQCEKCKRPSCIFPSLCSNLNVDHSPMTDLYNKAEKTEGVKHVFIGSGIRYDMLYPNLNEEKKAASTYFKNLVEKHISGRLKVAPEHTSDKVLQIMRKPSFMSFKKFKFDFEKLNSLAKKNQQLIPYFISSHPGSDIADMAELACETKQLNFKLEQVQDFTPTPMTLSSCMFYTGFDPYTGKKIFVTKSVDEKKEQQQFFFWYKREKQPILKKILEKIKRKDLIDRLLRK
jgi:uncharacterized radical SAM protein YgiQ